MATGLASQLKALASAPGRDNHTLINTKTRTRPSLLFDPREAADVDLQTIFSIAQTGLEELVLLNKSFASFRKTLFSAQSTQTDRDLETKEFNEKLNSSLGEFLRLLSGYVLLAPAHQVLEYLIRRYKIHVYNVDDVLISFLPFHETSIFVRIVQLLRTEKTEWEFLRGVKQSGAAPPRDVLVQRCTHDMSFLEAVCDSGIMGAKIKSATHTTFSSVTVLETASTIHSVTKEFVSKVLPFILQAFEKGVPEEYRAGGLLIVGVLASRATLTQSLSSSILEAISKAASTSSNVSSTRLFLMTVIEVVQTQELESFPLKAFKYLVKVKDLAQLLGDLVETYVADKFVSLFIEILSEHCVKAEYYQSMLCEMIAALPLKDHLELIVSKLIKSHLEKKLEDSNASAKEALQKPMLALEKRFPGELENCINNINQEKNAEVLEALSDVFEGSLRKPLAETGCSVYSSINHSQADIRKAALNHIVNMCQNPLTTQEAHFVCEALLSRLLDSNLGLVLIVLGVENLERRVPLGSLLKCFDTIIHRSMNILLKGPRQSKKDAKDVVKACLKLLESWLGEMAESSLKDIQRCLLCYVLLTPKTWRLNLRFLKVSAQLTGPLLKHLPNGDLNDDRDQEMSKEKACAWRAELNSKIVKAFADAVKEEESSLEMLMDAALANENAKNLSCFVTMGCFSENLGSISSKCFQFLRDEWNSIAPTLGNDTSELSKIQYDSGVVEVALYQKLDKGADVYPELLLLSLYKSLPTEKIDEHLLLFAGSPAWEVFKPHILRVLELQTGDKLSLLVNLTLRQGGSVIVQVHSFNILAWFISEHYVLDEKQSRLSLSCCFATLATTIKSVRVAAVEFLKAMKKSSPGSNAGLQNLLQAMESSSENFINDGKFLPAFCSTYFTQDDDEKKGETLTGLIEDALRLPITAQTAFFDVIRDVGFTGEKAAATQSTLFLLLERRRLYHATSSSSASSSSDSSPMVLTEQELDLVDKLLKLNMSNVARMLQAGEHTRNHILWALLESLDIEGGSPADPAVVRPCLLALSFLTPEHYNALSSEFQDQVFESLIELAASLDTTIRPAAIHNLDKLEIKADTITRHIQYLYSNDRVETPVKKKKRAKRSQDDSRRVSKPWPAEGKVATSSVGFLEFLLRKTKVTAWDGILNPLVELLRANYTGAWPKGLVMKSDEDMYFPQLVIAVMENVIRFIAEELKDYAGVLDVHMLVEYMESKHPATRNQALATITEIGKLFPEIVVDHVVVILAEVCSTSVIEDENQTHKLVQELLESIVPFWLSTLENPQAFFQIFLETLPRIPPHRQTDLMKSVLRVANEETSLPAFLIHLLRKTKSDNNWPIVFAEKLSMNYDSDTRIPAIVKALTELQSTELASGSNEKSWLTLQIATGFVVDQLRRLEQQVLQTDTTIISHACSKLMELALQQLQLLGDKKLGLSPEVKASCMKDAQGLLDTVTKLMSPGMFCKTVASLLEQADNSIRRMVLKMYITKLKDQATGPKKKNRETIHTIDANSHTEIAHQISKLLESSESLSHKTKQAAASALEAAVERFGVKCSASSLVGFLPAVVKNFGDSNEDVVAASIRCSASIVSAAGAECLASLPEVMPEVLKVALKGDLSFSSAEVEVSVLLLLEAAVEKLGAFLSPYIEGIVLLLISPAYVRLSSTAHAAKLMGLQKLVAERIPARLLLDPLMNAYKHALDFGETSTSTIFQMLASMCSKLDKASVAAYNTKIFKFCLDSLDLRRKHPESFTFSAIDPVEDSAITAIGSLVLKLSETSFRPLFVAAQEWASSTVFHGEPGERSVERSIVFYKLVNHLASRLRSVFVPYFRYLLDECLAILGKPEGTKTSQSKKKKTTHLPAGLSDGEVSLAKWHLRHLVVSALHKCFLYDNAGFLDSAKFQQLLQPLASQLVEQVPPELQDSTPTGIPSVDEVDETLVSCLGRMALTAGSDVLWKPLNHEVLMKTRGYNKRAKLVALRVVKFMSENLKEEYLVLIPETIPFLSELLEDEDINTVSNTQEVIKMLEDASGESLAQYM